MQNYSFSNIYARLDKSHDVITKYCNLVEDCYRNVLGLKSYKLNPYDIIFDNSASPVIIMSNNKIIGGAVLYTRSINEFRTLPLEKSAKININDIIKQYKLKCTSNICEISKIAVFDNYRDRRVTKEILGLAWAKAFKENCGLMFAITAKNKSRTFRIISQKVGIKYDVIDEHIPKIPLYEDLDIELTYANFNKFDLQKLLTNLHFSKLISRMLDISTRSHLHLNFDNKILKLGSFHE